MVMVVDAYNFLRDIKAGEDLKDRGLQANTNDERTITNLLVDQVEFANPNPFAAMDQAWEVSQQHQHVHAH
jgi:hypothetical protein